MLIGGDDTVPDAGQGGVQPLPALVELVFQFVPLKGGFDCRIYLLLIEGPEDIAIGPGGAGAPDGFLAAGIDDVNNGHLMTVAYQTTGLNAVGFPLKKDIHQDEMRTQDFDLR